MRKTLILKNAVSVLAMLVLGSVALLFMGYGLLFKSLEFIKVYFDLLFWISASAITLLTVLGVVCWAIKKQTPYRIILCTLVLLDIVAAVFYFLCATGLITKITSVDLLREYIASSGSMASIIYIIFCFLQVVLLPVPGSIAVAVGVAMFGPLKCAIYAFIGIILGSFAAFIIGRLVGYKAVCWMVGKDTLDKWLEKIKGKDYLILSLMFLLPAFPDDVLCFVAGLSSMTTKYFIIMIIVTRLISVASTSFSFELIPFNTWWGLMIWGIILTSIILSFYLVLKHSDKIDGYIKSKLKLYK